MNRKRKTVCLILVSALLIAGMVILFRGSWLHTVAVLSAGIYLGIPTAIVGAIAYLLRYRSRVAKQMASAAAAVLIVIVSLFISLIPGHALVSHDIEEAKTYCEALIPRIESYHQEHGVYPTEIAAVLHLGKPPHLLRHGSFYWSNGQEYRFDIGDPRGIMNFIRFISQTREWQEWH
jgi:hypothetical protein